MTSPTQLKYLDTMGISVWVSRDLVTEQEVVLGKLEIVDPTVPTKSPSSQRNNVDTANSAQTLLNSLEQISAPKISTDNVVAESVESRNLSHASKVQTFQEPRGENLVFKSDQHYVFANGDENADWMIIGHSPERFNGIGQEPFAGDAGVLLENMTRSVGIDNPRRDAYFVNIFDFNRNQDQSLEVDSTKVLNKQLTRLIDKVNPKLVLLVGQNAAQNLLSIDDPLIIMRSKIHQVTDKQIPCVVTYYPSYLLQKPIDKRKAWNDLKLAMSTLLDVS